MAARSDTGALCSLTSRGASHGTLNTLSYSTAGSGSGPATSQWPFSRPSSSRTSATSGGFQSLLRPTRPRRAGWRPQPSCSFRSS